MSKYKYPYIADKKMYAAVMGACRWIREDGYFNKATQYYADKYDLDVEEVRKEVRKRQAAGKKGKKTGKMKWFCVVKMTTSEAVGGWTMYEHPRVVKAKSRDSAGRDYSRENMRNDYGGVYAPYHSDFVLFEGDTKKEAENYLNGLNKEKLPQIEQEITHGRHWTQIKKQTP